MAPAWSNMKYGLILTLAFIVEKSHACTKRDPMHMGSKQTKKLHTVSLQVTKLWNEMKSFVVLYLSQKKI